MKVCPIKNMLHYAVPRYNFDDILVLFYIPVIGLSRSVKNIVMPSFNKI